MFPIATADDFGTICGFRLGRLSSNDVKWEEINMALGQATYLLVVLSNRFSFQFDKHEFYLCGPQTRIGLKNDKTKKFELYMNPSVPEERFSTGLVHLLSCLNSLGRYISSKLA